MIGRIALPKTTVLSLNDRFSSLRELRERQQEEEKQRLQQQQQQLRQDANHRLALQMESRPAVRAALTPTHLPPPPPPPAAAHVQAYVRPGAHTVQFQPSAPTPTPTLRSTRQGRPVSRGSVRGSGSGSGAAAPPQQQRGSVKQRLAVTARLGAQRGAPSATKGALAARLGTGRAPAAAAAVKRLQPARKPMSPLAGGGPRGSAPSRGGRGRGRARATTRADVTPRESGWSGGSGRGRGGGAPRARGRGRGAGGRAGARGRAAARGAAAAPAASREDLDKQLDAYMASTRGHLDAELDEYMKEARG